MRGPTQNLGQIGSAVLTLIRYKQNKQTPKHQDKKAIYIDGVRTQK